MQQEEPFLSVSTTATVAAMGFPPVVVASDGADATATGFEAVALAAAAGALAGAVAALGGAEAGAAD